MGLGDALLKGKEVELAQRTVADLGVRGEALGLVVVGDVVLGSRSDTIVLHTRHVGGGEVTREHGVFTECLEVATAEGRAVQVDGGAKHHVDTLATGLDGRGGAIAGRDAGVPGRRQCRPGGEVEGGAAFVPDLAAHTAGAIGDQHAAQSDLLNRPGGPEVAARQQLHLLLEGELAEQRGEALRLEAKLLRRSGISRVGEGAECGGAGHNKSPYCESSRSPRWQRVIKS